MTIGELAPTLFVALFVLACLAILGEVVFVVRGYSTRARGEALQESASGPARTHRILRIVAPVCLLGAGTILAWLSLSPGAEPSDVTEGAPPQPARDTARPAVSVAIDGAGIGAATAGMTLADLAAALATTAAIGEPNDRFMVDVTALPVVEGTDTLYHLLFPAGTAVDAGAPLELVATTHSLARTADGIGPGTTLEAAAERYGPPTLSYSVHDESREYARFPRQPSERIRFRVAPGPGLSSLAGSYQTAAEYNETSVYDPEARIFMVLVSLRPAATSGAAPPP